VIAFLRAKPRYLDEEYVDSDYGGSGSRNDEHLITPSPRSWNRVSNVLYKYGDDPSVLEHIVPGWLGIMAAHSFRVFRKRLSNLNPIEDYFEFANDSEKLRTIAPDTTDALYGLLYNVVYRTNNGESILAAAKIINAVCSVESIPYRNEVKTVGYELLMKKLVNDEQAQQELLFGRFKQEYMKHFAPYISKASAMRRNLLGGA